MFLRPRTRRKDGKEHRYWSIVENRRCQGNRVTQRQVLCLGEINDSRRATWCRTIDVIDQGASTPQQVTIFPEDLQAPELDCDVIQVSLSGLRLERPRQ